MSMWILCLISHFSFIPIIILSDKTTCQTYWHYCNLVKPPSDTESSSIMSEVIVEYTPNGSDSLGPCSYLSKEPGSSQDSSRMCIVSS